jgi:hypothetical protein
MEQPGLPHRAIGDQRCSGRDPLLGTPVFRIKLQRVPAFRAALIYQHRTAERDRLIAAVMSDIVEAELGTTGRPSGTYHTRPTGHILMPGKRYRDHACEQAFRGGAGDENRTRTISLGI